MGKMLWVLIKYMKYVGDIERGDERVGLCKDEVSIWIEASGVL